MKAVLIIVCQPILVKADTPGGMRRGGVRGEVREAGSKTKTVEE